jgi:hypothetical protein
MTVFIVSDSYGLISVHTDHGKAIDAYNARVDSTLALGDTITEEVGPRSDHPRLLHEAHFESLCAKCPYCIRLERWDTDN